jgi:hypothetical protein
VGSKLLNEEATTQKTYTEIFEESFPFYLAIGMSYAEYWNGDCSLARYYRKAYQIKQDEINHNAWLQGLYVYDAVSTVVYNALKNKNDPKKHYAEKHYDFKPDREKTEAEKAREVEIEQEKAAAWMDNLIRLYGDKK